ncbi:MAG: RraA family protein [bacterium]|nr:RraA family protein [bacterium]
MADWKDDGELFALMKRELFTAVVGDVMDQMGLIRQFLPPELQPLRDDLVVAGRAMPVLEADCTGQTVSHLKEKKPFGVMLEALDDLKANEVYICTGSSPTYALWGELMSIRAMKLGAAGAVLGGYSRDTSGILALNFPTFSTGRYAQDQGIRGRVIDFRCAIEFPNGVRVTPGDLVFGDLDGVVVVPQDAVEEVIAAALTKARGENKVREAIEGGMGAKAAFDTFGIM